MNISWKTYWDIFKHDSLVVNDFWKWIIENDWTYGIRNGEISEKWYWCDFVIEIWLEKKKNIYRREFEVFGGYKTWNML